MFNPNINNPYLLSIYPPEDENTPKENSLARRYNKIPLFEFTRNEYYAMYRARYDLGGYYGKENFELKHLTEEEVRVGVFVELFEPYTASLISLITFPFDYFFTYPKLVQGRLEKMAKEAAGNKDNYYLDGKTAHSIDSPSAKDKLAINTKAEEEVNLSDKLFQQANYDSRAFIGQKYKK